MVGRATPVRAEIVCFKRRAEDCRPTLRFCHPERSETESKDRVELLFGLATGFLDFARNDGGSRPVQFRQLAPEFAFAFSQLLRDVDLNNDVEIAAFS
jgi:hypothetical protein